MPLPQPLIPNLYPLNPKSFRDGHTEYLNLSLAEREVQGVARCCGEWYFRERFFIEKNALLKKRSVYCCCSVDACDCTWVLVGGQRESIRSG